VPASEAPPGVAAKVDRPCSSAGTGWSLPGHLAVPVPGILVEALRSLLAALRRQVVHIEVVEADRTRVVVRWDLHTVAVVACRMKAAAELVDLGTHMRRSGRAGEHRRVAGLRAQHFHQRRTHMPVLHICLSSSCRQLGQLAVIDRSHRQRHPGIGLPCWAVL